MDNESKPILKNVKISEHVHNQVKKVARETGINIGKLMELGAIKVVEEYNNGTFDPIKSEFSKIRRDGTFTRN
jgi:hypothetical protein